MGAGTAGRGGGGDGRDPLRDLRGGFLGLDRWTPPRVSFDGRERQLAPKIGRCPTSPANAKDARRKLRTATNEPRFRLPACWSRVHRARLSRNDHRPKG